MALDGVHSCRLGVEQDSLHVAGHVDKEQEEVSASRCGQCHGATEVTVHELQLLLGAEACLVGEGELPLLDADVGVIELLHVLDSRHALDHLLVVELLQGLEVEVPKALVPLLGVIVVASCMTHGLHHLHVEDIEAVGASIHLGEKAAMAIPDVQDPVLDLYA